MDKSYNPYSLFACAIEEVSKCYRFSRQDWRSYVKSIDYYSVGTSCLSTPDFDVHCERNLPASKRERLYAGSRKFLRLRKKLMEIIFDALAQSVVNFQNKDNIPDLSLSTKVRARYIKYARILTKMHKLDVMVNTEDNIQNLLRHIQEERARVKWLNKFAYWASVSTAAPRKDVMYNFGGGEWAKCNIGDGVSCTTPGGGHNKHQYDNNMCGNQVGGGDITDDISKQTKMSTSKDGTDMIVDKFNILRDWSEETEKDYSFSLYGMICA